MTIGLVTTSFPRDPGDASGGFVAEHARWLAAQGHRVEVIAAGPPDASGVDGDIRVHRIESRLFYGEGAPDKLAREPGAWLDAGQFAARLAWAVRRRARLWERAFAHWIAPCGIAAAVAAPRVRLTVIAHSGDVHLLRRIGAVGPAVAVLERAGARVAFVAEELRDALVPGPTRLATTVCSMGIDAARFESLSRAPDADSPTVLFVGRLVPVKGVAVLIDAMARLERPARLVVAGGGPDLRALRERAAARGLPDVAFMGPVSPRRRDELLAAASVVALPSVLVEGDRTEGTPVAVLEAMAAGVPVVASRVGGIAELPAGIAVRVAPDDPVALASALDRVLSARPLRMVRAARAFARDRDWHLVGPRLMAI